jgi:hypothetical protein
MILGSKSRTLGKGYLGIKCSAIGKNLRNIQEHQLGSLHLEPIGNTKIKKVPKPTPPSKNLGSHKFAKVIL